MCTYDDINGVYFSLQSLRLYHPLVQDDKVELIVIDNNPAGTWHSVTKMDKWLV